MIDSRAMNALLYLWSRNIAVLVTQNGSVWQCECAAESKAGYTGWKLYQARSIELAIEKAATAEGWLL